MLPWFDGHLGYAARSRSSYSAGSGNPASSASATDCTKRVIEALDTLLLGTQAARGNRVRQRDGVHLASPRWLCVLESRPARLQSPRETWEQLLDRGLQWLAAARVPLATLVCLDRRGPADSRRLAGGLQHRAAPSQLSQPLARRTSRRRPLHPQPQPTAFLYVPVVLNRGDPPL